MERVHWAWFQHADGRREWAYLISENINDPLLDNMEGVYVIWRADPADVIKVGQGVVRDRLRAHLQDPRIQSHAPGGLLFTCAPVAKQWRDGVELFLGEHYQPLVSERFPACNPVYVNLPGAEVS